jgi:hypothetical protein
MFREVTFAPLISLWPARTDCAGALLFEASKRALFLGFGLHRFPLAIWSVSFGWRGMAERYHSCFYGSNEIAHGVNANCVVPSQKAI